MSAYRAELGSLAANVDMTAVSALPDCIALAGEDCARLNVGEKLAISCLVLSRRPSGLRKTNY